MADTCTSCGTTLRWKKNATGECHPCSVQTRNTKRARAMPADFAEHAAVLNNSECAARWSVSPDIVIRWRREAGIASPGRPGAKMVVPDGFAAIAPTLTRKQLRERYGRSIEAIDRWLREAGVRARRAAPLRIVGAADRQFASKGQPRRDPSRAGQAADFLRRFGPVYRCDARGAALADGFFWNRGGFVLSDEEVVARAERQGWDAEAWRRVA